MSCMGLGSYICPVVLTPHLVNGRSRHEPSLYKYGDHTKRRSEVVNAENRENGLSLHKRKLRGEGGPLAANARPS